MRYLFVLVLTVISISCNSQKQVQLQLPAGISYEISKDETKAHYKRSVNVMLNKKVNKEVLANLGRYIKSLDSKTYERTFIGYNIVGSDTRWGYWATTHYDPDLKVEIARLSIEEEKKLINLSLKNPIGSVIGSWVDDSPYVGEKVTFTSSDDVIRMYRSYADGNTSKPMIMKTTRIQKGLKIEIPDNGFGEYFVLPSGSDNLEYWSKNRNYYTAKPI